MSSNTARQARERAQRYEDKLSSEATEAADTEEWELKKQEHAEAYKRWQRDDDRPVNVLAVQGKQRVAELKAYWQKRDEADRQQAQQAAAARQSERERQIELSRVRRQEEPRGAGSSWLVSKHEAALLGINLTGPSETRITQPPEEPKGRSEQLADARTAPASKRARTAAGPSSAQPPAPKEAKHEQQQGTVMSSDDDEIENTPLAVRLASVKQAALHGDKAGKDLPPPSLQGRGRSRAVASSSIGVRRSSRAKSAPAAQAASDLPPIMQGVGELQDMGVNQLKSMLTDRGLTVPAGLNNLQLAHHVKKEAGPKIQDAAVPDEPPAQPQENALVEKDKQESLWWLARALIEEDKYVGFVGKTLEEAHQHLTDLGVSCSVARRDAGNRTGVSDRRFSIVGVHGTYRRPGLIKALDLKEVQSSSDAAEDAQAQDTGPHSAQAAWRSLPPQQQEALFQFSKEICAVSHRVPAAVRDEIINTVHALIRDDFLNEAKDLPGDPPGTTATIFCLLHALIHNEIAFLIEEEKWKRGCEAAGIDKFFEPFAETGPLDVARLRLMKEEPESIYNPAFICPAMESEWYDRPGIESSCPGPKLLRLGASAAGLELPHSLMPRAEMPYRQAPRECAQLLLPPVFDGCIMMLNPQSGHGGVPVGVSRGGVVWEGAFKTAH